MNALFNYSKNLIETISPPDFLLNFENMDEYAYNYAYSYSYFGTASIPNDPHDQALLRFTALATQVFYMQDEFAVFFASIRNDMFFAVNQGQQMDGYNPHIRPWYVNHLIKSENLINQSPPYITWGTTLYVMTQTTNLTYFDGSIEGVIAAEYNYSQFQGYQYDSSVQTFILGYDGLIQMTFDENFIGAYIYNQSITGYSYIDYIDIIQSIDGSENISKCTYNIDLLCLVNQLDGVENFVMTKLLPRSNVIIMLQIDPSPEFELIDEIVEDIVEKILQLTIENILIHFGARLVTTVISVTLFFIISKPIYDLVAYTKQFPHNQQSLISRIKFNRSLNYQGKLDPIFEIKKAYFELMNNLTCNSKCETCQSIELLPEYCFEDMNNNGFRKYNDQIRFIIQRIRISDYIINN